jgi:hypothetical protein
MRVARVTDTTVHKKSVVRCAKLRTVRGGFTLDAIKDALMKEKKK